MLHVPYNSINNRILHAEDDMLQWYGQGQRQALLMLPSQGRLVERLQKEIEDDGRVGFKS